MDDVLADQRRYFREKFRSRLCGINACLKAKVPGLLVRALSERANIFLSDHCQVGFAMMLIISAIPLCRMKKAQYLLGLGLGLWLGSTIRIIYMRNPSQFRIGSHGNYFWFQLIHSNISLWKYH
jgi:hypothetical protein